MYDISKSETLSLSLVKTEVLLALARVLSRSVVSDCFAIPWTAALQAHLPVEFFRQQYWSGLPFPTPGDLPGPGIEPVSPALAGGIFSTRGTWNRHVFIKAHYSVSL